MPDMIYAALTEAADAEELLLVDGGLCRFHLRRDGTTTIREIIVLPARRREGIGRRLVEMVQEGARGKVVAGCPVRYESNRFWQAIGFTLARVEKETTNVWEWQRPA